jgi:branched-chain amino acid transport system substrate-binding protein
LQGEVSFDENGDVTNRIISVFQIHNDPSYPADDMVHQYKYIGVAPSSSA